MIDVRKLGGLSPDKSASSFLAGLGKSGNKLIDNSGIKPASPDVIQEEKRASPGHRNVVNAMVDEVLRNYSVFAKRDSDLELRSDSIDTRNQDGIPHSSEIRSEKPSKPADPTKNFRPKSGSKPFLQPFFNPIA